MTRTKLPKRACLSVPVRARLFSPFRGLFLPIEEPLINLVAMDLAAKLEG